MIALIELTESYRSHVCKPSCPVRTDPASALRMYPQEHYQVLVATSTIITVPVCVFLFIVTIFLMNLLVAQLTQSYHDAFSNMQARA